MKMLGRTGRRCLACVFTWVVSLRGDEVVAPWLAGASRPPAVVDIDVGRQLFVDDYIVESSTLERKFHRPIYHPQSPVLRPDAPWEGTQAIPFSDGVWYDPADELFKMWYYAGKDLTCLATSRDGIHWEKPKLDVQPGTNVVLAARRDSSTVILDHLEQDPQKRFKLFRSHNAPHPLGYSRGIWGLSLHYSPDGIHWSDPVRRTGWVGDRSTVFYNPFRRAWIYSLRNPDWKGPRQRYYWESRNLESDPTWDLDKSPPRPWITADERDLPFPGTTVPAQLYNLDAVAYESLLLGFFTILRGDVDNRTPVTPGRPKPNNVCIGYSRDGFHWSRPDRNAFFDYTEENTAWNWGNVQSAGGGCLIVGDRLYFYVSGRRGANGTRDSGASTGLAILRRDGFASMDGGARGGVLTTRPLRASGRYLFVNARCDGGELRVEVLDEDGIALPGFGAEACAPVRVDSTLHAVAWSGVSNLSALRDRKFRLRFHLREGSLFSFWLAPGEDGASGGYVAGGGPGFTGPRDTRGAHALRAAREVPSGRQSR